MKQEEIIHNMRTRIKLEEYGLENVNSIFLFDVLYF
jgi:hypothetical protein